MKKIVIIIREILKFVIFWGIVILVGYMAFSKDPEINWLIRLIGFIAIVYFLGDYIYHISVKEKF